MDSRLYPFTGAGMLFNKVDSFDHNFALGGQGGNHFPGFAFILTG